MFDIYRAWLTQRNRIAKISIVAFADLVWAFAAVFIAYALRLPQLVWPPAEDLPIYLLMPVLSIVSAYVFRVYDAALRLASGQLERLIVLSQVFIPPIWAFILFFFQQTGFPRSVLIIYFLLVFVGMIGMRRLAYNFLGQGKKNLIPKPEKVPVLIFGAGSTGLSLLHALREQGRYNPVAFMDTDYTLLDRTIAGLRVYTYENLLEVVTQFRPREVLIAKPELNRSSRRVLVEKLLAFGLSVKTMPAVDDVVGGKINLSEIRDVKLEDLLGRDPVPPDMALMAKAIRDQVVMITGAGGSIGSELVRQAFNYRPAKIVLFENSEFALFEIRRELEFLADKIGSKFSLEAVLADVKDQKAVEAAIEENKVDIIFHAAAYKHVRLVQDNAQAGILNNVWGTKTVAEAAGKLGVKRFVLISTDKAVRPTSVMGASKRVAEMVVQALAAQKGCKTIFSMVRFGNVLGSTGSVIPLFREQIAKGGPIEVTDPEVTRFFMLIPEAAQLVIQAGAMAEGGEVFVLDMGESVKIVQLAETMIELAGLTRRTEKNPEGDIEINFVGLREGEKLYEELQIGNDIANTPNARIMKSQEFFLPSAKLQKHLDALVKDPGKLMGLARLSN